MSFTWEWALAIFVFLFANLFLGVQLLKLFWPLRMLKLTAKMRKEAVDPQSWLGLAADENAVRAALPIREAIFLLQKGTLSEDEMKYRKLWLRSWVYTIATLVLVYVQPQLASGSEPEFFQQRFQRCSIGRRFQILDDSWLNTLFFNQRECFTAL